jgi:hypothetical protein
VKDRDILADLRAWRDEFARSHGYDLRAMVAELREMDVKACARVVRGEPRRPTAGRLGSLVPPEQPHTEGAIDVNTVGSR